ncbi:MBL fold metallo-hydrolase [Undibacterium sp. Jales W-56]|uniref:MBL fold metallo-hydrolase n=1 Tax=Undibacterium sp. Jales W-56 TaxID=2897325 RepID=UPI0021D24536|nr:MBL fold metallo-hydrolase [Undibacterium sp. Jales W-56]MCU6434821.1 MBL fold metallo-hydrolase [Undibacterium sp. Jales W-56]
MNPLELQLDYPLGEHLPETGQTTEIAPGVLWVRMGLPFALNHINLWLIEDDFESAQGLLHGWTLVDCGISSDATRDAWESLFSHPEAGLRGLPIVRVIATHCHPDHVGLADWLCARWQAPLWMTAGEYAFARMMSASLPGADGSAMFPHFKKHGMPSDMQEKIQERKSYYTTLVPAVPTAYHRMQEGRPLRIGQRDWQVITGFGHSPEHASLYCADLGLLIAGDMLLPRISTNVSVFAIEPEANPVQQYLDSLAKYAALPDDVLILPSHGKPFRGLSTRIQQLNDHHRDRLAEVVDACASLQSAADIVPVMFRRPLDAHQITFAMGEALAHLHKLWFDGILRRELGDDGIIRFIAI